jgi:hypothetical protein
MTEQKKTVWIELIVPSKAVITHIDPSKPYVMISLANGVDANGKVVTRQEKNVNGITTILSKKLLAKVQPEDSTDRKFVFPEHFTFNIIETKFNEQTKVYDDVARYTVSAHTLPQLI